MSQFVANESCSYVLVMGTHLGPAYTGDERAAPSCKGPEQPSGSLTAGGTLSAARAVEEALATGMDLPASPLLQTLPVATCKHMGPW